MTTTYHITLQDLEIGRVLDSLESRADSWENTARYLRPGGASDGDCSLIEDCSRPEEAEGIAAQYRGLIQKIRSQIQDQE